MSKGDLPEPTPVLLDYAGAAGLKPILENLSGLVAEGDRLWTVSDESRTVECLTREGDGYRLTEQIALDDLFPCLPEGELDLEGIDLIDGAVWLCGSHCRVRLRPAVGEAVDPRQEDRPARHFLGLLEAGRGRMVLPPIGKESLRAALARDEFVRDFLPLPGKENGLDIEGIAVLPDRFFLGLRGPVIDSHALVLEVPLSKKGKPKLSQMRRHFLDLGGLGIRDLVRDGDRILVLAGPVSATRSPFQLHAWVPGATEAPACLGGWKEEDSKPEGICRLDRDGRTGLLAVHDSAKARIDGSRFRADWFPL